MSLRKRNPFLIFLILAAVCGCAPDTSTEPPSDWVRIDAGEFRFHVPPDFEPVAVQGVDSIVGSYQGSSISLGFDYGSYSDPLRDNDQPNYTIRHERIDGRKARIVSYDNPESARPYAFSTGIHFAAVNGNGARLTLLAACKTRADLNTARTIFRTIQFK